MNKQEQQLRELCLQYTDLEEGDIQELIKEARKLENNHDDYQDLDIFIDVYNKITHQALVVYHCPPRTKESIYKRNIIGEDALFQNEPGVLRTIQTSLNSEGLLAHTQEKVLIKQNVYPIQNKQQTIGVLIFEKPFLNPSVHKLENNQESYRNISSALTVLDHYQQNIVDELLQEAILVFNEKGQLVLYNLAAEKLYQQFGYMDHLSDLHYDSLTIDGTIFKSVISELWKQKKKVLTDEISYLNFFLEIKKIWNSEEKQLILLIQDKTEIKEKESEIILKSVAIREIHHRVKNNLQTIVSLLRIQERRTESEEAKKVLRESVSRILAISSTHELLSKQVEDEINLEIAVESLVFYFKQIFIESQRNIEVKIAIDPYLKVKSEQMVTISLVINELLQNIYDHAFEGKSTGNVTVSAHRGRKTNEVIILIEDNGKGYDTTKKYTTSLGLMIVSSYVKEKLHGKIQVESSKKGTSTRIFFKTE